MKLCALYGLQCHDIMMSMTVGVGVWGHARVCPGVCVSAHTQLSQPGSSCVCVCVCMSLILSLSEFPFCALITDDVIICA